MLRVFWLGVLRVTLLKLQKVQGGGGPLNFVSNLRCQVFFMGAPFAREEI